MQVHVAMAASKWLLASASEDGGGECLRASACLCG